MKKLILFLVLFPGLNYLAAQDTIQLPVCKYITWISLVNTGEKIKGVLYKVRDSSVVLIHYSMMNGNIPQTIMKSDINFSMLNILKMRKNYAPLKGALLGTLGGGVLGGFYSNFIFENIVWETGIPPDKGKYIITGGFYGAILGTAFGTLAGMRWNRFIINGDKSRFIKSQVKLKKYSYLHY